MLEPALEVAHVLPDPRAERPVPVELTLHVRPLVPERVKLKFSVNMSGLSV